MFLKHSKIIVNIIVQQLTHKNVKVQKRSQKRDMPDKHLVVVHVSTFHRWVTTSYLLMYPQTICVHIPLLSSIRNWRVYMCEWLSLPDCWFVQFVSS